MHKIEINILSIVLTEACFLLLFFKDSFINIILGIIIGITLILLTSKIKKNIITKTLLIIISIFLYLFFTYKTIYFISDNILKNYSILLITVSLVSISIYIAMKNYHTLIKTTEIIFYLILFIKIVTIILTIPLIKVSNLSINFNYNYKMIYISLFILFLYKSIYYLSDYKLKKQDIIISFSFPILIKLITLLTLGNTLSNIYKYPYVSYLKKIKYFDFIERMEGILSFEYVFCFIILISFLILNIKKSHYMAKK